MLYIEGNDIKLTRGDSAYLHIPIENRLPDGSTTPYELAEGDVLVMTMRLNYDSEICFQKTVKGVNTFHIVPDDTKDCKFGKYKYDVQLTTTDGDVYTVIEPACFQVLPEVTCD
jgi:hypothetical protein